jgi:F-type H+-transporting ATPase subunit b
MELVLKIFETLEVNQLALAQMGLVIVLAAFLNRTLINPILATFDERERLSSRPLEESRKLLAEAEARLKEYEEAMRKAAAEALAAKRRKMEETGRAERKKIEAVLEETNRQVEKMRAKIAAEKSAASAALRTEVARLSVEIAGKVLGRQVA